MCKQNEYCNTRAYNVERQWEIELMRCEIPDSFPCLILCNWKRRITQGYFVPVEITTRAKASRWLSALYSRLDNPYSACFISGSDVCEVVVVFQANKKNVPLFSTSCNEFRHEKKPLERRRDFPFQSNTEYSALEYEHEAPLTGDDNETHRT